MMNQSGQDRQRRLLELLLVSIQSRTVLRFDLPLQTPEHLNASYKVDLERVPIYARNILDVEVKRIKVF